MLQVGVAIIRRLRRLATSFARFGSFGTFISFDLDRFRLRFPNVVPKEP